MSIASNMGAGWEYQEGQFQMDDSVKLSDNYGALWSSEPAANFTINYPYGYYQTQSAREQVQDEILTKMAAAIESDDLKKAKELVKLAKALKEL